MDECSTDSAFISLFYSEKNPPRQAYAWCNGQSVPIDSWPSGTYVSVFIISLSSPFTRHSINKTQCFGISRHGAPVQRTPQFLFVGRSTDFWGMCSRLQTHSQPSTMMSRVLRLVDSESNNRPAKIANFCCQLFFSRFFA